MCVWKAEKIKRKKNYDNNPNIKSLLALHTTQRTAKTYTLPMEKLWLAMQWVARAAAVVSAAAACFWLNTCER